MNTNLASFIVGIITDENDRFYFVQKDGQFYALSKEEGRMSWVSLSKALPTAI